MDPSDLEGLSEEQLKQLMELGIIPDEMSMVSRQYKLADALRGQQVHDARSNGRVTTAASPLEAIGTLMQNYAGKKMAGNLDKQNQALLNKQLEGRNLFLQKFLGNIPGINKNNYQVPDPAAGGVDPALIEELRKKRGMSIYGPSPL